MNGILKSAYIGDGFRIIFIVQSLKFTLDLDNWA